MRFVSLGILKACSSLTFQGTCMLKIRNTNSIISKITVKARQGAMKTVNINTEIVFGKKNTGGNSLTLIIAMFLIYEAS
jgi:uncharacterized protein YgiM (DUF1202 family)